MSSTTVLGSQVRTPVPATNPTRLDPLHGSRVGSGDSSSMYGRIDFDGSNAPRQTVQHSAKALFYFTMYNGPYPVNTGTYKTLSVLVDRLGLIDLIKQTWIRHLHFVLA